ncbi:MAG: fimbrillin family protein [Muribaculaceae bacterium]|nr:fimbrillin family protein [Muribaculaceae bacterium]
MKLRHFFPCLLLAGMAVTVASCTDEANLTPGQGRNVTMTVNISRVGDNTRSILTENEGDLKCTWEAEDLILVVDGSGNKLGVLSLKNGAGEESATFVGEITTDAVGATDLNFLYLGSKSAEEFDALTNPVVFDYSAQNGTIEWLSKNDFFSGSENVEITNSYISVESVSLSRQISFGKFDMQLPAGVTYAGQPITVSGEGLNTKASISMTDGHATFSEEGNIVITRPEGTSSTEFYLTVLPATITPTFSVTIDGKTYSCTLAQKEWEASKFVRKDNLDRTFSGIVLNMTDKTSENNPYEGYENEDPRNPLHKFAKYNLVRVGERGSLVNGFADSETENGALYQWGRNYGYMDKSGTWPGSSKTISGDFTNYFDALGDFTWYDAWNNVSTSPSMNYYRLFDCYVYPENAVVTSGTGLGGYGNGYEHWANIDNYERYGDIATLQAHLDKYFFDMSNNATDYWLSSFSNGGSTWTDRAKACGYADENPCPKGWRMPTEEDFKEICPSSMPSYKGNLSTLITQKAKPELRETRSGIKYVIRWQNYSGYLKIQAVVVETDFTEDKIAAIIWDDNEDVVERTFPYTGNITPYATNDLRLGKNLGGSVPVRFPYTMGTITQTNKEAVDYLQYGYLNFYYPWTLFTPNLNYGSSVGGYWIGDSKMSFQFFDISKAGNTGSSSIDIRTTDAQTAYAIRPVMDK